VLRYQAFRQIKFKIVGTHNSQAVGK